MRSERREQERARHRDRVVAGALSSLPPDQRAALDAAAAADAAADIVAAAPPAPQPAPDAVQLTDAERAALEAEKQMLIEAGRRGAFRSISPEPADAPPEPSRSADMIVRRLEAIGQASQVQEREFIQARRAELKPLVAEANEILAAYRALHAEISPRLAELSPFRLDYVAIRRTCREHHVFGAGGVDNLRDRVVSLIDALDSCVHQSADDTLGQLAKRAEHAGLSDIQAGLPARLKRAVELQRGGPAALRGWWVQICRLIGDLDKALEGKSPAVPPLKVKTTGWAGFDPFAPPVRHERRSLTD
jgi:hypothetical protein